MSARRAGLTMFWERQAGAPAFSATFAIDKWSALIDINPYLHRYLFHIELADSVAKIC